MFFCDPCYIAFRSREDGITHVLTSPVHNAALLARPARLTPYEFAGTQLTYMVRASPEQTAAAAAEEQAEALIALATMHATNPAFRAGMRAALASPSPPPPPRRRPPVSFGVRVIAPASIECFVYTYARGDLDSMRAFRTAIANACVASGCVSELDWGALCARKWVVNVAGIDLPELLTKIRTDEDVARVKRAGLLPGDGWNRVIQIGG